MSEKYKPAVGDRVRVVYEGVVNSADDTGFVFGGKVPVIYDEDKDYLVSVEKVEPPATVFKPGDLVRIIGGDSFGNHWLITKDGYVNGFGEFVRNNVEFTSKQYELVSKGRL